MAKTSVKACQNIWGNWNVYIGNSRYKECGESRFDAVDVLSGLIAEGYLLSDKSDVKMSDIIKHQERFK